MSFKFAEGSVVSHIGNKLTIKSQNKSAELGEYYIVTHTNGFNQEFDAASLDLTAILVSDPPAKK